MDFPALMAQMHRADFRAVNHQPAEAHNILQRFRHTAAAGGHIAQHAKMLCADMLGHFKHQLRAGQMLARQRHYGSEKTARRLRIYRQGQRPPQLRLMRRQKAQIRLLQLQRVQMHFPQLEIAIGYLQFLHHPAPFLSFLPAC